MKVITIDNVLLQFDSVDKIEVTEEGIKEYVNLINNVLSSKFPYGEPQLVLNLDSKITIIEPLK
jgi:hypothetical protein